MPETHTTTGGQLWPSRIGRTAAAALVAEFARRPPPRHGLIVGGAPDSPVLTAATDSLTADDRLTVAAGAAAPAVAARIARLGGWVGRRVRVVEAVAEAEPADAVILADIVTGGADPVHTAIDDLAKHLTATGVLCAAVPAAPFQAGGAGVELDRLATLHGVGSDLVLRNLPPLRVHRLRIGPTDAGLADAGLADAGLADARLAERMRPLPRTSSIRLTDELHLDSNGVVAAGLCLGAAMLIRRARPGSRLWLVPALAAAGAAAFFRDPQRAVPEDAGAVVSACDGRVMAVERLTDELLGTGEFLRVSVFLSVLDVHINRAPVAGRVIDQFRVPGGYAPAMRPDAGGNAAAYTVLRTVHGTVAVAQRAGLLARRIVQRAPVGTLLARGERFGLIRFGSRTDVYLPADAATASVAPGDRVVGGETIIARWISS